VDRSGRHVLITAAGKPNDRRPAAYVVRDGYLQRVPFDGDCWQADWLPPGPRLGRSA
jgi:hypothetical protein